MVVKKLGYIQLSGNNNNNMKVVRPGNLYTIRNFNDKFSYQRIQFIHKELINGKLEIVDDGTTNEELLEVIIDRLNYLQGLMPCRENEVALIKLDEALLWLNKRTADRQSRDVVERQTRL
jgi:hypothetical protein